MNDSRPGGKTMNPDPQIQAFAPYVVDDGGRAIAGYKGYAGDCVTRAIAIATETPYSEVYSALHVRSLGRPNLARLELLYGARARRHASPRDGVPRKVYQSYLESLGWTWTPTMQIGQGCVVHLRADELPSGRIIVRLSRHLAAVIDGVLHDTHDSSRDGTRCVYGFFSKEASPPTERPLANVGSVR